MADSANITPIPSVAALHAEAIARAEGMKLTAQLLAERLGAVMKEIHGIDWVIHIDHEHGLVLIRPRLERREAAR